MCYTQLACILMELPASLCFVGEDPGKPKGRSLIIALELPAPDLLLHERHVLLSAISQRTGKTRSRSKTKHETPKITSNLL